ncbi:helix-turn-helix domain-containing protein [Aurantimonas sp. VKM B-3413]|uniref:helix-turn-helix domain-containing protein n=1 Tax=Aurantimonas sp. VKM B-3413 TaxID=2779401 RepID=UPI001E653D92|nr:helix-turn-helix domain-containing protein [Aurantimonas sp. VKM B-3413]MCB8836510.1 helix-turn-helix domain containing protein [Aurantimonas sp. VKM B-3413]
MEEDPADRNARADRLRTALRKRGISKLYALAADLNVDQSTVSRWTTGGRMSLDHSVALALHLNLSLDWLILGRGQMEIDARSDDPAAAHPDRVRQLTPILAELPAEILEPLAALAQALHATRT